MRRVSLQDRVGSDLFPKWTRYIPHRPWPKQLAFLMIPHREALYGGAAGGGKGGLLATPCNATKLGYNPDDPTQMEDFRMKYQNHVLTPFGFKPLDDVRVGDAVCNPDGTTCFVIQVHEPRMQKCYRVSFIDGSSVVVGEDHRWSVKVSGLRTRRKVSDPYQSSDSDSTQQAFNMELMRRYKTVETTELLRLWKRAVSDFESGSRPRWPLVPLMEPANFQASKGRSRMLPAYTLGVWLGDGSISERTPSWFKPDEYIASQVSQELALCEVGDRVSVRATKGSYGFVGGNVYACLESMRLAGCRAWEKFVPNLYKNGHYDLRIGVLNGLLDTDGHVDNRGQCYYDSTSEKMVRDVQYICRSLGYSATISDKPEPTYIYEDEKKIGRPAWRLYITGRNRTRLFRLPRKRDRITELNTEGGKQVTEVLPLRGELETRCITVSHPNGLYVTNDFVVTHNSDALLMAALQYVDVPGYSAIIFRKSLTDLELEGNLIPRSHEWLGDTPAQWNDKKHRWQFPCGPKNRWDDPDWSRVSTLQFGFMGQGFGNVIGLSKTRYSSAEFQFIAFDELNQHFESDYLFMFSRLRQRHCPDHKITGYDPRCPFCVECYHASKVPLRFRATTNPGGIGGSWIRQRFQIKKFVVDGKKIFRGIHPDKPFIPAFASDNKALDVLGYEQSLAETDKVTRDQLQYGDWDASEEGRFRAYWLKKFSMRNADSTRQLHLRPEAYVFLGGKSWQVKQLWFFLTVDVAASVKEGPGDKQIWTNKTPSKTAICAWAVTPDYDLMWLWTRTAYVEIPDILPMLWVEYRAFKPEYVGIENNSINLGILQGAKREGMTVKGLNPRVGDKLVRATQASIRMERGQIWIPEDERSNPWLEEAVSEVMRWTGHPNDPDDVVDCLAYAAMEVAERAQGTEQRGVSRPKAYE